MPASDTIAPADPAPATPPPSDQPMRRPQTASHRLLYAQLFASGFLLRFGFMLWHKTYIFSVGAIYEACSIAEHVARGQGFSSPFVMDTGPTAWIAPLYPYFVSLVYRLFGTYSATSTAVVLSIQCLMAAATGVAIFELGRRTLGQRVGFWSAWIWTVSPFFFRWPTSWIWDMTFSALALSLALLLTFDLAESGSLRLWLRLGALWGVIALTNPALLSVLPFTLVYAAAVNFRAKRAWFRGLALSSLIFAAIIAPWLIRNAVVFHQPVFLRSNYWYEFRLGNFHYSNGLGFSGQHPTHNAVVMAQYEALGEIRFVQQAKQDALRFVREHPYEFIALTLYRTLGFWDGSYLPLQSHEWWKPWEFWPLSAAGLLGLLFATTRRPPGWLLYAGALLIYPIPYYLSYPLDRYRHALEPELVLLAVYLAFILWGEHRQSETTRPAAPHQ
jgi:4-amino-4-deoxy-L-arabinose transferase-like glycosyltransferase